MTCCDPDSIWAWSSRQWVSTRAGKRKALRRLSLVRKGRRFHSGVILSSRMRRPFFGALGRISSAGTSRSSRRQTRYVTSSEPGTVTSRHSAYIRELK